MILFRILSAAAITLLPIALSAQPKVDQECLRAPGKPSNCTPLVACIPEEGVFLTGRAFGWSEGSLAGVTNAGYACTGYWTADGPFGAGKVELSCENGQTGIVLFTYQDAPTGTTTGFGKMSNGHGIQGWSGHNIQQFLINESGDIDAKLLCSGFVVPIG